MEDFDKDKKVRIATKTGNPEKNAKPFNAESLKKRIEERKKIGLN